jgi:hypothetical protein
MPSTTNYLKLTLPGNGEYTDTWDEIVNENFVDIDAAIEATAVEIEEARLGQTSLKNLLSISINNDGTLKATKEVIDARNSFIYGDEDVSNLDVDLKGRLNFLEKDLFYFRAGMSDFRDVLGKYAGSQSLTLSGVKDSNNYPTWLASTGANVQIDGSVTNIFVSIYGKLARIRKQEQLAVSGAIGTKHLYMTYNPNGLVRVDGTSLTNGVISSDGSKVRWFDIPTSDFSVLDVKAGDILEILGTGLNAGQYQIKTVSPGGVVTRVLIYGTFKSAQSGLSYTIRDPFAVSLGFDDVLTEASNKFYFGIAVFDGTSVTSTRAISFFDYFVSEWRAVDVSSVTTFTEVFNHNLFDDVLDVDIEVSQTNDGTDYVEQLSMAELNNSLSISNSLSLTTGDQALGGAVALSGTVTLSKSAKARWNKYQIEVSNVSAGLFYKDFSGASMTNGYIRVVARKMRK